MPNAINKYRPNLLVKVEKENENQVIKRKQKIVTPKGEKPYLNRVETVWERLSKVKKSASNESGLGAMRSRLNVPTGSSHRLPLARGTNTLPLASSKRQQWSTATGAAVGVSAGADIAMPMGASAAMHSSLIKAKRRLMEKHLLKKKKVPSPPPRIVPRILPQMESFVYLCRPGKSVKEILTARSICNSKSSSEGSKHSVKLSAHSLNGSRHSNISKYYSQLSDTEFIDIPATDRLEGSLQLQSAICSPKSHSHSSSIKYEDSLEYQEMPQPPAMMSSPRDSLNSSIKIESNFRDLLKQKHKTMPSDQISVIKNVVKTDERYHHLQQDDSKLFKEILKTQLREILKQELAVKSALSKLDSPGVLLSESVKQNTPRTPHSAKTSISEVASINEHVTAHTMTEQSSRLTDVTQQKPKVDVIFKNVPTLEKEIIILKALGEKLEATLKRTTVQSKVPSPTPTPPPSPPPIERRSAATSTSTIMVLRLRRRSMLLATEHYAQVQLRSLGIRQLLGLVKEFRIAHKTIVELKEDAHRHFYLPVNNEKTELKRTNFLKLKENPDVLMRYLRPKNSAVNFNVLEQDAVFFNSFIFNPMPGSLSGSRSTSRHTSAGSELSSNYISICEGGDSRQMPPLQLRPSMLLRERELQIRLLEERRRACGDADVSSTPKLSETHVAAVAATPTAVVRPATPATNGDKACADKAVNKASKKVKTKLPPKLVTHELAANKQRQRQRMRRSRTPMPLHKTLEPKNNLVKTILVGSVQISVFLLLIMAFTYPDVKC